jgi:hypothetical protein
VPISVTAPIDQAIHRTKRTLFQPFSIGKWFTLGFCAFLASLGEGGGGNINIPTPGGGGGGGTPAPAPFPRPTPPGGPASGPWPGSGGSGGVGTPPVDEFQHVVDTVKQFVVQHAVWIIPVILFSIAIGVLLLWVRSRGKFMFLDGVVRDHAAVIEPWKRLRPQGNSFFRFELALAALIVGGTLLLLTILYFVASGDIHTRQFGAGAVAALGIGALVIIPAAIVFSVAKAVAVDFLVPIMYARETTLGPAWQEFRRDVAPGNVWPIVLFYLMRIVIGIATAMIMGIGMCVTCFLAALPYLSSVVFLPLFVFNRCYSLYFLQQFGSQYVMLVDPVEVPPTGFPVVMPPPPIGAVAMPPPPAPSSQWPEDPQSQPPPPPPSLGL